MRLSSIVALASCFTLLATSLAAREGRADSDESVALVLVLVIDQLRRDRLSDELPGGLGQLVRGGRVFRESLVDHGLTETCPGHVVVVTGRHPGPSGITGNRTADPETGRLIYCVSDESEQGQILGHPGSEGRSPVRVRVDSLGDWMKAQRPGTRVFAVSAKDRSAVAMGGQHPDAAFWFQRDGRVSFSTSRHYADALPRWLEDWNGHDPPHDGFLSRVPDRWEHSPGPDTTHGVQRADGFAAEESRYARTSGHRIRDDDLEEFADRLYHSPFIDELTLDLARQLVVSEDLGRGDSPDLLLLGLSATDLIGHFYGPESHESRDGLLRLDAALAEFLGFLDDRLGSDRVLIALTADHGVLPLPEWLELTGRGRCRTEGGRADVRWLGLGLLLRLHLRLGPWLSLPADWVAFAGAQVWVNRSVARERGVPVERVMEVVAEYLSEQDEIARVWTRDEILAGASPEARLYRNSFDPERSGDLFIQLAEGCLLTKGDHGTTHGTPYLYDRAVPLLFYGPGVAAGVVDGAAASVDVAPTLAGHLGIRIPDDLDGRRLPLGEVQRVDQRVESRLDSRVSSDTAAGR